MKVEKHIMSNVIIAQNSLEVAKKADYSNLSIKDVKYNKFFWKIVKLLFSEKVNTNENIKLVDNNNTISSEIETARKAKCLF